MKKISIIIPYRDRKNNLQFLLNAFENQQDFENDFELIIVDLGSNESILDILTPHSKHIYVNYKGLFSRGYACNIGVKNCSGNIIWLVDADCMPHPFILNKIISNFNFNNENFAINCPVIFLNPTETNYLLNKGIITFDDYVKYKNDKTVWLKPHIDGTSQICMHRKKYIELGGIDERFIGHGYEDLLLHDQIADLNPDFWSRFPEKKEVQWSIQRDLVLIHFFHGYRNYRTPYMSKYRDNLKLYKYLISKNVKKNNVGKEWGKII